MCGGEFHHHCDRGWSNRYHKICKQCHEWERAWANEDFEFEEEDEDDRPVKKRKQDNKKVECIDLVSSDEDSHYGDEMHNDDSLAFDVIYI